MTQINKAPLVKKDKAPLVKKGFTFGQKGLHLWLKRALPLVKKDKAPLAKKDKASKEPKNIIKAIPPLRKARICALAFWDRHKDIKIIIKDIVLKEYLLKIIN